MKQLSTALRIEPVSSAYELHNRCRHALDAGFDGVELLASAFSFTESELGPTGQVVDRADHTSEPAAILALAGRIEATDTDIAREELAVLLRAACDLQAQRLNLAMPPLQRMKQQPGFARYQDVLNFTYELFTRARLDCEAVGVAIGLEVGVGGCFLSPVEVRELVDAVNSSAFGTCVDLTRVERIGSTADWLETLGRRVCAVRVQYGRAMATPVPIGGIEESAAICVKNADAADGPGLANLGAILSGIGFEGPVIAAGTLESRQLRALLAESGCPVTAE